jgi:hypothetical protein
MAKRVSSSLRTFSPFTSDLDDGVQLTEHTDPDDVPLVLTVPIRSGSPHADGDQLGRGPAKSSVGGASANYVNSIVGAGIIGMPYAIKQCGFVLGVFLLCLVGFLCYKSVNMLIRAGLKVRVDRVQSISQELVLGKAF